MNSVQQYRKDIAEIERRMMRMPQQEGMRVTELNLPGVYVRNLFIPAGTLLTGMIHKTSCINILASGVIQVWTESEGMTTLKGFCMFESGPGSKRIGKTFTDVNWVNIFPVDRGADVDNIVNSIAALNYDDPNIERLPQ